MFAVLEAVRDALALVPGVRTARIGMESTLSPADYPIVRLVPSKLSESLPRLGVRKVEALVYFGVAVHEFEGGLEALYGQLLGMESTLLAAMRTVSSAEVRHLETILDEDRVDAYKLMALRVVLEGAA